jgi:hypothetical protein
MIRPDDSRAAGQQHQNGNQDAASRACLRRGCGDRHGRAVDLNRIVTAGREAKGIARCEIGNIVASVREACFRERGVHVRSSMEMQFGLLRKIFNF